MKRAKIIVTGGAGFIGTNLLHALLSRYPDSLVVSLDIRDPIYPIDQVIYERCDVTLRQDLHNFLSGADKIFHLAAIIGTHESFDDPYLVVKVNLEGTVNLLEYVRGELDTELYVAGMPGIWNNPYSISKDAALRMSLAYFESYNIKFSALRWYSVYGPYQYTSRYNKAVPTFINSALNNKPIPVYGDGNQIADFLYVDDAVNLAIDSLENKCWGKVIACSSGVGVSVNTLASMIIKLCNSNSKIEYLPMRLGEPPGAKVIADTTELSRIYNRKSISLEQGLIKTIDFYKTHTAVD